MKFLHLGDLHLGKNLGDFDLIDDQRFILEKVLGIVRENKVDGVLIAGDVYDRSVPSEAATKLLDWFLNSLSESGTKTFIISGNHDSDERLNYGSQLFRDKNIFISAVYDGSMNKYTMTDEYGDVDIWLLPFVKSSRVRHYFPDAEIENYNDAVRTIIESADVDTTKRNIIVAHQFVINEESTPEFGGSESAGTLNVGTIEAIDSKCFDSFDYVALGHIHSPQRIGRDVVRYSGSPLKYSLKEENSTKSVPLFTLGDKGDVSIDLIPLIPRRDLRPIRGSLAYVMKELPASDDYLHVTLTDDYIDDVMGIIRQKYPYTVKLDYDNQATREIDQVDISRIAENRSFSDLIGDFYRQMYGEEISDEEMSIMRDVAKKAGVINEAD